MTIPQHLRITLGTLVVILLHTTLAFHAAAQSTADTPPLLIDSSPSTGEEWDGGAVTFTFDQPMSEAASAQFSVRPLISGDATIDGNTVTFMPTLPDEIEPGQSYVLSFNALTESAAGVALSSATGINLIGAAPLSVTAHRPSDGTLNVDLETPIMVVFNQPIVALTSVDDEADRPDPLTISPAVEGVGEWTSTSIYTFQPTEPLLGATDYTVTVAELESFDGKSLSQTFSFSFTTLVPQVVISDPQGPNTAPNAVVHLNFNQAMDRESIEESFALSAVQADGSTSEPTAGEFGWNEVGRTLTFTPSLPLELETNYRYSIDGEIARSASGTSLVGGTEWEFTTIPLPSIQSMTPISDSVDVAPDMDVEITFSTAMSRTSVLENLSVTPLLTTTTVFSRYNDYNNTVVLSWAKEPQTTYTVTVDSAAVDAFGNPLGEARELTFTTGDHRPWVRSSLEQFTHFTPYTTTRVGITYRNVESIEASLYRLPIDEFLMLVGENAYMLGDGYVLPNADEHLIWDQRFESTTERNQTAQKIVPLLDENEEPLPPGIYLFELDLPAGSQNPQSGQPQRKDQRVVILSNYQLTVKKSSAGNSLAWITDLITGEPAPAQNIQFWDHQAMLAESPSDDQGISTVQLTMTDENRWRPVIAIAGTPGNEDFAVASTNWNQGISPWEFNINGYYYVEEYQIYAYTERPIYRPGQTIYWKAIVRDRADESYVVPEADLPVRVRINNQQGETLLSENGTLNENGTLHGQFTLDDESPTGYYYIEITAGEAMNETYGGTGFQVAAYRKPEFEISMSTDQPEYKEGETIQATVEARYFSGGPMANAQVTWRLLSQNYSFTWEDQPDGRYFSFQPYDPDEDIYDPFRSGNFGGLIKEGVGQTGPDGKFSLELPADLTNNDTSQSWTIDVTIQSSTNQFVSASTNVTVHKSDYYIGISPQEYVVKTGDEGTIDLVTLTPEQAFYPNADLEVVVQKFNWNSVYEKGPDGAFYWTSRVERTPVLTESVRTDESGMATIQWTPTEGGSYQIVARGTEQPVSSAGFVYVSSSDSFVSWRRENHDRIELVADKDLYNVGDVAEILVPSPFMGEVNALVTIERGGVLSSEVMTLQSNSEILEIPITAEHIPNVFVSVLLVKGVDETNPYPAMRLGYVQLQIDTAPKELTIEIESSMPEVRPGDTVSYTVEVRDVAGDLVPNAEVSVALVDKAIFTLSDTPETPLIDIFYAIRALGVETGALLNINLDRISQQLTEGTKGGGGGDGGGLEIRGDFRDVAYWQADLTTDENGVATFAVDLPDNLTTWRLVARAITADTLVGDADHELIATKRLQMRTLLPRFVTAGDQVQVGAALLNTSLDELTDGNISFDLFGARLVEGEERISGLTFAGEAEETFDWTIEVEEAATSVDFIFAAQAYNDDEPLSDGVRVSIPVKRFATRETVGTAGTVEETSRVEAIRAPLNAEGGTSLIVQLEPSLAAGMLDSLDYLQHYPHECNEQLTSRFLPNLFTVYALRSLDIPNEQLESALDAQVNVAVQKLVTRQNPDGGWGYWPGEESANFVTAYILWGLWHTQELGYTVPEHTLTMGLSYLENFYVAPGEVSDSWQLNELAFVHMVMAEMGQGDPGRMSTLYDQRDRMQHYGKAYLAQALAAMATAEGEAYVPGSDPQVENLLDDLFASAELTATGAFWAETDVDYRTLNTNLRSTAIILATFSKLAPDDPMLPGVVRWLMDAREVGRWPSTQENAWSLIALTEWMKASGELEADYGWLVDFDGETLGEGRFDSSNLNTQVRLETEILADDVADAIQAEAQRLLIERDNTTGQLYYTTYMRYYLNVLDVEARDRGFSIQRRFETTEGPVNSVQVGDVISVTTTLIAPTDRHQVLVEVPIPAGTEPIDPNLATESEQFGDPGMIQNNGGGYWWWQWQPTHVDTQDDRVAFYATFLPAGTYEYTFQVRATVPGEYRVRPAYTEQMYFTEVWGRSEGSLFIVEK